MTRLPKPFRGGDIVLRRRTTAWAVSPPQSAREICVQGKSLPRYGQRRFTALPRNRMPPLAWQRQSISESVLWAAKPLCPIGLHYKMQEVNMCEHSLRAAITRATVGRRTVLKLAAAASAGFAFVPRALAQAAKAPPKPENVLSPDAALERLMSGNARYVQGVSKRHDFSYEREPLRTGQNPFAAVLSCADSRIAPEYCFDTARGDVFVCRVAGNFASDEMVASLEYAVQVLNTPLIMVLGHDACGAVDATAKSIKDGSTLPGRLPALVAAISPAVKAVQGEPGDMLENAIRRNVLLNVEKLQTSAPILNTFVDNKKVRVVGGIYKLASGKVELLV
jgi:carbonic anhydrase